MCTMPNLDPLKHSWDVALANPISPNEFNLTLSEFGIQVPIP
jgi:hypothetical protein